MILFLDVDGVLHPSGYPEGDRYQGLSRLIALMREVRFRQVDLVLTGESADADDTLRCRFPADMRHRLVGRAPCSGNAVPGQRERDIRRWLATRSARAAPWVAVDHAPDMYAPDCRHLLPVDPRKGLDAVCVSSLRRKLVSDAHLID